MTVQRVEIGLVSDTDALVTFYESVFGLGRLGTVTFPMGTVHRLGELHSFIKVFVPTEVPVRLDRVPGPFWSETGQRYFTVWTDSLDDAVERCRTHGGTVETAPMEIRPGVRTAVLIDPDGNSIEAMEEDRLS